MNTKPSDIIKIFVPGKSIYNNSLASRVEGLLSVQEILGSDLHADIVPPTPTNLVIILE